MQELIASLFSEKPKPAPLPQEEMPWLEQIPALLPDAILLVDEYRDIVWANKAAVNLSAMTPVKGRNLLGIVRDPGLIAAMEKNSAEWIDLGEIGHSYFLVFILPLNKHVLLLFRDVTEARNTDRLRRDFIANISHELKTPLTALSGFIETLRGPAGHDAKAQDRFLTIMARQVVRMQRLVADLLSLSRIEMSEHLPIRGEANLREAIQAALETLPPEHTFTLDWPAGVPHIIPGEREELIQAIGNLLDNAVKYGRPPFEIRAEMVTDPIKIARYGKVSFDRMIALSIIDHGEGIAPEHLPRLTERFYRVDPARSQETGGTGLGLAIVKHIMTRHRGALFIHSEKNQGSIFTCYLPLPASS